LPVVLGGAGLPYEIEAFDVLGHATPEDVQRGAWIAAADSKPRHRTHELPSDGAVIRFAEIPS
jgi:hypothetical protein